MSDSEQLKWYVAKTKAKQERAVVQKIEELGVEAYVPVRTELRNWSDRKRKVEAVLIPNTIFVKTRRQMALDLHNVYGISLSYLRDVTDPKHALLVIPEAQMAEFQRFVEISKGEFDVEQDAQYVKGDMVIVTNGPLKGITGELLKIEKKNKVVVRLQNLIACSVTIDLSDLEKVNGLV